MINIDKLYIYIYMYECVWYTWIRIHCGPVCRLSGFGSLSLGCCLLDQRAAGHEGSHRQVQRNQMKLQVFWLLLQGNYLDTIGHMIYDFSKMICTLLARMDR